METAMTNRPIDDGGPAFPCGSYDAVRGCPQPPVIPGMSLRDWFAWQAEISWDIVLQTFALAGKKDPKIQDIINVRAQMRYLEADAMLVARKGGTHD